MYEFRLSKKTLNPKELKDLQQYIGPGMSGVGGGRDKYKRMYTYQKRHDDSDDDESWSEQSDEDEEYP